ncbi:MAG: sugar transferase [Lachnospiraceae bacterium]|nr:sugar transferase [Lachnospiraceae bacterium]
MVANKENLYDVSRQATLDEVFLFLPNMVTKEAKQMIIDFESMGVVCHYSVDALDLDMQGKSVGNFAGYAVITFALQYMDYRRLFIKRAMDILGGFVGLVITGVLTPFVALAIKLNSKGPVFFAQTRVGKNGRRFRIYKFRSMYIDAEERKKELEAQNEMKGLMFKMENDPRITSVGKFLRKTSIDELPQFFNVFKGDMSLVGTRPPTEDEFEQYNIHYRRRLSITPGLTGMWQVKGRGKTFDFDEVVEMDLEYIDNWSLGLDVKILFQTVFVVLFGVGAK